MRDRIGAMASEGLLAEDAEKHLTTCITAEGHLRLLPGILGTDGFFIAVLEKTCD
jgi:16S rRNA C967 or C1407 C5-methylase (RsmB/RsmF family)